jgi:hypothetical protein
MTEPTEAVEPEAADVAEETAADDAAEEAAQ